MGFSFALCKPIKSFYTVCMMRNHDYFLFFAALLVLVALFFVPISAGRAFFGASGGGGTAFGGVVTKTVKCDCMSGLAGAAVGEAVSGATGVPIAGEVAGGVVKAGVGKVTDFTLVTVGSPKGGMFMLSPATKLYLKGNVSQGHWVLGLASGGMVCIKKFGKICLPVGGGPIISMVGTN